MLRNVLIKKYVDTKDTQRIIGHSSVVYIKKAIITIVLLFYVVATKTKNGASLN